MQLTELYRMGFLVPKDYDALVAILTCRLTGNELVEFVDINLYENYYAVCGTGFFHEINEACDTIVDDYEEDVIKPEKVQHFQKVVLKFKAKYYSDLKFGRFLTELDRIAQVAMNLKMPIFVAL